MIKLTVLVKRKQGMSFEEFDRYWEGNHGKVVMSVPEFTRHLRRYVQSHVKVGAASVFPSDDGGFDGYAELWFDDIDGLNKAFSEPAPLKKAEYCKPTLARPPPSTRSQPGNLLIANKFVSSNRSACESSLGKRPICDSFGRATTWTIGSIICEPQECALMNG